MLSSLCQCVQCEMILCQLTEDTHEDEGGAPDTNDTNEEDGRVERDEEEEELDKLEEEKARDNEEDNLFDNAADQFRGKCAHMEKLGTVTS